MVSRLSRAELRRGRSSALLASLALFGVSLLAAGLFQFFVVRSNPNWSPLAHASQAILNTFVTFAALELVLLLIQAERLKRLIARQNLLLEETCKRESDAKWVSKRLYDLFETYRGSPVHDAVGKAVRMFIKNITVADDCVSAKGEHIAIASYRWFWERLRDAQKAQSQGGTGQSISVFTTHSAPVSYWNSQEFGPIIKLQSEFVKNGGTLNRIFIRHYTDRSTAGLAEYANVIARMRKFGGTHVTNGHRNIFFAEMNEGGKILDFMITKLDGQYYSVEWDPRHLGTNNADIAECHFHTGESKFAEEFWEKWEDAVELLLGKDISDLLRYDGLSERTVELLASVPSEREKVVMLTPPD